MSRLENEKDRIIFFHVHGVCDVGIIWDIFIIFSFNMLYLYDLNSKSLYSKYQNKVRRVYSKMF